MLNIGGFTTPWREGEQRESRLTFIGKSLDKAALQRGFESCIDTPENVATRLASLGMGRLRFSVGDAVRCCYSRAWVAGTVVKLAHWAGRSMCPYQVELRDGTLIYAPHDTDAFIRAGDRARPSAARASRGSRPQAPRAAGRPGGAEWLGVVLQQARQAAGRRCRRGPVL